MFYAQRGEDQRLLRYLGLRETANDTTGFYVDIGAWEPTVDSVTKHFYDAGWWGINIEPVPHYAAKLRAERPRDINLELATSDTKGTAEMVVYEGSGLSTLCEEHKNHAYSFVRSTISVPISPLRETLDAVSASLVAVQRGTLPAIDFLKVDVEGHEREVILGNDWERYRPKIIVIEATKPGTDTPAWDTWDHLIIEADYEFLEFDGLNRWYKNGRR